MSKSIGFDIDDKKAVACVVQKGPDDRFAGLPSRELATHGFLSEWGSRKSLSRNG